MRILIADDHELVRDTLAAFLQSEAGIEVDTAADFAGAQAKVKAFAGYHLVLLDYKMPGMNGLKGLKDMQDMQVGLKVAIMSGTAARDVAQDAVAEGALGFLPKTLPAKSLINAVRFMAAGETYLPVNFMQAEDDQVSSPIKDKLSEREFQVLGGLCRGLANKEIARELDLQEVTVKLHVKTLCRKLEAKNRTHAAMIAKEAELY
ncbi:MAG: response regulator transcription factor [Mangrovicoccus sp.]